MDSDKTTSIAEIRDEVQKFVAERSWEKFHTPKNISMAMAIEVAELMEHFQWVEGDQSHQLSDEKRHAVGEEIADVFCYLMAIVNVLEIDLTSTFAKKMIRNREKYPVDEFKGRFGADDPNPVQT